MKWKVPLTDVTLGEEEALAAAEVVRSGWLTQGERIAAFEQEFAAMTGATFAFAVNNCTVGLELAYASVGVVAGDEVIVPSLTFVATANAAVRLGATPVFADITSTDDWCVSPEDIARKVTSRTRAVVAVHYAGFAADTSGIRRALDARGASHVVIVEDCAHAPGASARSLDHVNTPRCGTLGHVAAFSFFSNKNMTTGEGGMLTTNDPEVAASLRLLRSHGMTTLTWDRHRGHAFSYDVARVGTNARMDEIRAAIGRIQLKKLLAANAQRAEVVRWYREGLRARPTLGNIDVPFSHGDYGVSSHHLFVVLLPKHSDRLAVMTSLREVGIQTSIHYPPTHRFSAYASQSNLAKVPLTDAVFERMLTLPLGPLMSHESVDMVLVALQNALTHS
jgi:dTDP-4-amino-4,6-dideoxygalactose transaminase